MRKRRCSMLSEVLRREAGAILIGIKMINFGI
jgi:hypothetical protein